MKTTNKQFDAVALMRNLREQLASDTANRDFKSLRRYLDDRIPLEGPLARLVACRTPRDSVSLRTTGR